MRGKRFTGCESLGSFGLIPTHAGKTRWSGRAGGSRRAHPRSREENCAGTAVMGSTSGSSPLTRGKHLHTRAVRGLGGLIPAHAGKTSTSYKTASIPEAHPRSRGENMIWPWLIASRKGSSPLMRGKRFGHLVEVLDSGLIPAHAGKTPKPVATVFTEMGSSPLTWGKLLHGRGERAESGLIPAHAGKTTATSTR